MRSVLCARHLHGSWVRRLIVDFGAAPVCCDCRSARHDGHTQPRGSGLRVARSRQLRATAIHGDDRRAARRASSRARSTSSSQTRDDLVQQHGFLHAGVLASAADSACGYAALSLMPAGAAVLSIEFKINMLAPAAGDRIVARGQRDSRRPHRDGVLGRGHRVRGGRREARRHDGGDDDDRSGSRTDRLIPVFHAFLALAGFARTGRAVLNLPLMVRMTTAPLAKELESTAPIARPWWRPWRAVLGGFALAFVVGMLCAEVTKSFGDWNHGFQWEADLMLWIHRPLPAWLDLVVLTTPWFGTNLTLIPVIVGAVVVAVAQMGATRSHRAADRGAARQLPAESVAQGDVRRASARACSSGAAGTRGAHIRAATRSRACRC